MKTATRWRAGFASDAGLLRSINEDRVFVDEARGIFLVVDGLGGHAAGETAAAAAVDVVRHYLDPTQEPLDAHIRDVISAANNEIFRLAEEDASHRGMACVLTLAVMKHDHVVIGHVGDSRLYLYWNGKLKKITSDHSPVGEQEDAGLLTEEEAMHHPRRNEVYRDVGSVPRLSNDDHFIETRDVLFRDDAALLLCSDGLTDCVTAAEITAILDQFNGDTERSAQQLIEAANGAGGKDNISVVFVAGPDFMGTGSSRWQQARIRHATTRQRGDFSGKRSSRWTRILLLLLVAAGLGFGLWRLVLQVTSVPVLPTAQEPVREALAEHLVEVSPSNARSLMDALSIAVSGETISVPPGEYLGPLYLKEGVAIVAKVPRMSILKTDPSATGEPGIAIVAREIHQAAVNGLKIAADETHPLKSGILVVNSSLDLANLEISGAVYSGVRIEGDSKPHLLENFIHANGGAGVSIGAGAAPVLTRNQIMQNGLMVNAARPGIEVSASANPILEGNLVSGNGEDEPMKTGHTESNKRKGEH